MTIDTTLSVEDLSYVFSKLDPKDIASTNTVSQYWRSLSVSAARTTQSNRFKSFALLIINNVEEKEKFQKLLSETKISGENVLNLMQIKTTLLHSKDAFILLLNKLKIEKLKYLESICQTVEKPLFFGNIFSVVKELDKEEAMRAIARLYYEHVDPAQAIAIANQIQQI